MNNNLVVHRYKNTNYYLTSSGKIYRKQKNKFKELKGTKSKYQGGNYTVTISIDNKKYQLTRMMWETFKGEIPKGLRVVHKNSLYDNSIYNLKLSSCGKREGEKARKIINLSTNKVYKSMRDAEVQLNTSRKNIEKICCGKLNLAWYIDGKAYRGNYDRLYSKYAER